MVQEYTPILKPQNFIAGRWEAEGTGQVLAVRDKYHQSLIAEIPLATEAQMEVAIQSSLSGFRELRKWTAEARSEGLH